MNLAKPTIGLFFSLLAATSVTYAQEAGRPAELTAPNPAGDSYATQLRDADALIKSGKPADAYALLEPLEFEHSGDERFDYLIGIAALDSGKPDKATLAFERVLMVNPNSAAARLDMARAYYQLGDLPRAKSEFTVALKQNPTEAARANIEKYLDEIASLEAGKQARITGYLEGAIGYDSNVNNATSQSQILVGGVPYTLDPASVKASDSYFGVAAGGEITRKMNASWSVYAGADLRQRTYNSQKDFDSLGLDARAGAMFGAKANRLRIGVTGGRYNLGGTRNSDSAGLNAEWNHVLSPSNQLKIFGQYVQYRFVNPLMQPNDFNQQAMGIGWQHVTADGKSTLSGNVYHGTEKDVSPIIMVPGIGPLNSGGGRADGARRFSGLRVGGQTAVSDKTTLFVNAGGQTGNFSKVNPYFLQQRSDRQYELTAGANWQWNKHWTLRPQMNYLKNESNLVVYSYNKMDVSLNIRRDLR